MRGMAQATGLAYTTVHALVRHPDQSEAISFDVLARLSAYLACGPADLLGYGPPGDYAVGTDGDQDEEYERPTPPPRDVQWRHLGPDEEAPEPEEDEEYLLPEQWRQLHPDSVLDIKAHPASLAHEEHRRVLHPGPT